MKQGMKYATTLLEFGYSLLGRKLNIKNNHIFKGDKYE